HTSRLWKTPRRRSRCGLRGKWHAAVLSLSPASSPWHPDEGHADTARIAAYQSAEIAHNADLLANRQAHHPGGAGWGDVQPTARGCSPAGASGWAWSLAGGSRSARWR